LVSIEAGFFNAEEIDFEYGQIKTINYCKLSNGNFSEFWFAGAHTGTSNDSVSESADGAFDGLQSAFEQLGISFNEIVRQWNYVEQIFEYKQIENKSRQNYQLFNEVSPSFALFL